jgi:lipopolysaccharide/colanic/teichoic acid biosynthesis glycosyltransferase
MKFDEHKEERRIIVIKPSRTYNILKRGLDFVLSFLGLILYAPVCLIISIAIKIDSPGPIIYRQTRIGINGRPFSFYKFRTMYIHPEYSSYREFLSKGMEKDKENERLIHRIRGDTRVTRVGRVLRRLSLDELPQFFSVILGDMSLVGPRPPLPYEWEVYKDWHRQRLMVKPGITGLWQISGRSYSGFVEMVLTDLSYIERRSLLLDLKILLKTVRIALFHSEINSP